MNSSLKPLKLIIADGQFLVTESLKAILTDEGSFIVEAVVTGKNEIQKALAKSEISILIIDPYYIDPNPLSEIKEIRDNYPKLKFIVLTNSLSTPENSGEEPGQLTPSEMEIVRLISEGLTTKEIASRKNISFHTVITHRKNIFRKLGVSSVSELIMYAIKSGWINMIEYHI
ncbi:MAG: response regulator transcription factor [Bacteroidia bacterium]|nr:response regulator transcription factor [Bacteroidia bacterium]